MSAPDPDWEIEFDEVARQHEDDERRWNDYWEGLSEADRRREHEMMDAHEADRQRRGDTA